ncbi:MAG TPA: tyrosine--tRNA ligase [Nanoarchaeota archaeon]|nr:tyrosine--tRNA ligase [Nanoarchaeota archaeon]HII13544.1 tyrosine--tRNA ligase [Nanoarchaeota archaeon]HIJ05133.1 tyrosine--tRNA ligase [Nanoarchaeota archaeon]
MDGEKRFELITRNTEEVLTADDLKVLLENNTKLKHYIGFEISGKIHLGTGLMTGMKIADFQKAKVDCSCYLATWHAWINNKLGGDLDLIRKVGDGYFKEGLKVSIDIMGGDSEKVRFVSGDELYHNNDQYWQTVLDVSKNITLNRAMKAITIMGRKEGESVSFAQLVYPAMQVADIFIQDLNIAHAGLDQRKAHVIAREVAQKLSIKPLLDKNKKKYSPIAVHHHLILGLQKPPVWPVPRENIQDLWAAQKMSKSVPGSAVFILDTEEEIRDKLNKAFCPEKEIVFNPILDWTKHLLFVNTSFALTVERPAKFGGNVIYESYSSLEKDFVEGKLHPLDLKKAVAEALSKKLEPARKHFQTPRLKKLADEIQNINVSR